MNANPAKNGWSLEVVRGRDAGKRYALTPGELVLGNSPGGPPAIDLADQEGDSPRRMAARQAHLACTTAGLRLKDLDSPGGTFVNKRRVLPGQELPLGDGDVIQLGGVQLRVVHPGPATTPPPPAPSTAASRPATAAFVYTLKDGPTCRSWDDFLTVSAQRWAGLREELTSGRLATFLGSIGRQEFAPKGAGTPDERLDVWLAALPTTKVAHPEIDVHPATLVVRVAAGGGTTRRSLRVTNVGYRLLRSTARIEPPGTPWLRLAAEFDGRPFQTVEATDLAIEISPPESLKGPLSAAVVFEGNGGQRRVPVTLEPAARREVIPEAVTPREKADWGVRRAIASMPLAVRFVAWPLATLAARALILAGNQIISSPATVATPGLHGPSALFAIAGALLGMALAGKRGTLRDVPTGGFAGAILGVFLAALIVAACRAIEPPGGPIVALIAWSGLGAGLAGLSAWLVPAVAVANKEASP